MMKGTGTARSGKVSFEGAGRSMRKVCASTTTNCSGLVIEPAFICTPAKPPRLTARSKDHLTSSAVTGEPSQKRALGLSLKVIDLRSLE